MTGAPPPMLDNVTHGDCGEVMKDMATGSVDLILTDSPYLVNYRDRSGRQVKNDDNADWLEPAFALMARVLKEGGACLSFYAWNKIEFFMAACKKAGLRQWSRTRIRMETPATVVLDPSSVRIWNPP